MKVVAALGGYQNRKSDPPPGAQTIWAGLLKLQFITTGFRLQINEKINLDPIDMSP